MGPGVSEGFQEGILGWVDRSWHKGQRAEGFQACPTLAGKFLALFLCSTFLHLPTLFHPEVAGVLMPILLVRKLQSPQVMDLPKVMGLARGRTRSSGSQAGALFLFSCFLELGEGPAWGGWDEMFWEHMEPCENPQICSSEA